MAETEEKMKVFIAHGHNGEIKEALARIIEKNNFEAIILNEQLNEGKTIIEKLEKYTDVNFAFIIYTACDEGKEKGGILELRSRQNVIFEHGLLIGKLKRENTAVLYQEGVVEPSDVKGLGYTLLDDNGAWKSEVERILNNIKTKKRETKQIAEKDVVNLDEAEKEFANLDDDEMEVLKKFYKEGRQTLEFFLYDTAVSGLLNRKILYVTSSVYRTHYTKVYANFSISKDFKPYLDEIFKDGDFFIDKRDNQRYRIIEINDKIWLAENLRTGIPGSIIHEDKPEYGRFYKWDMASAACPPGWHLPSSEEWSKLESFLGYKVAGYKLKSKYGWNNEMNGMDDYGFSAFPNGYFDTKSEQFVSVGERAIWWTSSPSNPRMIENREDNECYMGCASRYSTGMLPARCVKD
jgi:uncharacterized protein (TIGR02145 family)